MDRRHREIREAAIGAFLVSGYDGTTMEQIAVRAGVSKQTVYKHFDDKQHLFADIVLSTTDDISVLIGLIAEKLPATTDLARDLAFLAETFLVALMQPRLLRLRRLVITSADRFPEISSAWYEKGFERVLAALASSFRALADRELLGVADETAAAEHFVGMLFWIPVNKAMFTGDDDYAATHDLVAVARAAAAAFLNAYAAR
ncbi:MAG: TetR/AcrR family transcriptional regulator [Acidimicrobiales bacterium]